MENKTKNIIIGTLSAGVLALGAISLPVDEPTVSQVVVDGKTEIIKEVVYQEKVIPTKTVQFKPYGITLRFRKTDSSAQVDLLADDSTNGKILISESQLDRPSVSDPNKTVRQLMEDFALALAQEPITE